jgi:hypothetical protein
MEKAEFAKALYKQIPLDDGQIRYEYLGDVKYTAELVDEDHIRFTRGVQEKVVLVKWDDKWAYKVQKTQIKATGGAKRLFEHTLCDPFWHNVACAIADEVIDNMRPAKGYAA